MNLNKINNRVLSSEYIMNMYYNLFFFIEDKNASVVYSATTLQDLALFFHDPTFLSFNNEINLVIYLLQKYYRYEKNNVIYYYANQNIDNVKHTLCITYKEL